MTTIRPAVDIAARAAVAARAEALLRRADALDQAAHVAADPSAVAELCGFWVGRFRSIDGGRVIDAVAGPGEAGTAFAFETARQLGLHVVIDGIPLGHGQRVLVVGPQRRAGDGLPRLIRRIEAAGGEVVGCQVVVGPTPARSSIRSSASGRRYPLDALWQPRPPAAAGGR